MTLFTAFKQLLRAYGCRFRSGRLRRRAARVLRYAHWVNAECARMQMRERTLRAEAKRRTDALQRKLDEE